MSFGDFMRSGGLWLSKTLLVMCIMLSVVVYTGNYITSETFLKPIVQETISSQFSDAQLVEFNSGLSKACGRQSLEMMTFPLTFIDASLDVNCTRVKQLGINESRRIINEDVSQKTFDSVYLKKVCSGSQCLDILKNLPLTLQNNPLGATDLVSRDFNDYVHSKFLIFLSLSILFAVLVLVLAKSWESRFMSLGGSLVTAGLPYFGVPFLRETLKANLPAKAYELILRLVTTLSGTFLTILISGVILLLVGLGLKFYFNKKYGKKTELKKKK
jgi:hypothetical protein